MTGRKDSHKNIENQHFNNNIRSLSLLMSFCKSVKLRYSFQEFNPFWEVLEKYTLRKEWSVIGISLA